MKKEILTLTSLVFAVGASEVCADSPWYVTGQAGASFADHSDWIDDQTPPSLEYEGDHDTGFNTALAFGKFLNDNFRVEGEISYRRNGIDGFELRQDNGFGDLLGIGDLDGLKIDAGGRIEAASFMINGLFEFEARPHLKPYVGAGIGFSHLWFETEFRQPTTPLAKDTDVTPSYQLIAGIGYDITSSLTAGLDYRYFSAIDPSFREALTATNVNDYDYQTHNWSVNLRYKF